MQFIQFIQHPGDHCLPMLLLLLESGWWFGTFFVFPYIGNFIMPTDHIFQRGRSTTNQEFLDFLEPNVSSQISLAGRWCDASSVQMCWWTLGY